jgi:hypothetical protein
VLLRWVPYLHHLVVLAGGGHHGFAFGHVHADRLLHVHVGAGLHGVNHLQGVPVVGRADEYDVELVVGQHLAVIPVEAGRFAGLLAFTHQFGGALEHVFVHVAEGHYLHRRHLDQPEQVVFPVPPRPDQTHPVGLGRIDEV